MAFSAVLLSLGKWRYLIAGTALALLFGLICRAVGKLFSLRGQWLLFTGTCTEIARINEKNAVAVRFTDVHRLHHTAAFCTGDPDIQCGDPVRFAIRTAAFSAGTFPQHTEQADTAGDILSYPAFRSMRLRTFCRTLCTELLICGAALAVFVMTMKFCFPARG